MEVTNLRPSYSPEQIRSGQNNFLTFNLDVFTNSGGASVSGTDLWMVEVFTNTNSNGDGTSLGESEHFSLTAVAVVNGMAIFFPPE